jgi:hypothetical protein
VDEGARTADGGEIAHCEAEPGTTSKDAEQEKLPEEAVTVLPDAEVVCAVSVEEGESCGVVVWGDIVPPLVDHVSDGQETRSDWGSKHDMENVRVAPT